MKFLGVPGGLLGTQIMITGSLETTVLTLKRGAVSSRKMVDLAQGESQACKPCALLLRDRPPRRPHTRPFRILSTHNRSKKPKSRAARARRQTRDD